jgi:hypothetical protein
VRWWSYPAVATSLMKVIPRLISIEIEIYMKTPGSFTQSYEVNSAGIKPSVTSRNYAPWTSYSPTRTGFCGYLLPSTFITDTTTRMLVIQHPVTATKRGQVIECTKEVLWLSLSYLLNICRSQCSLKTCFCDKRSIAEKSQLILQNPHDRTALVVFSVPTF